MSTRKKSELGVSFVAHDLIKQGYTVCLPMSEHAAFDLVAVKDNTRLTVQVKYRTANKFGAMDVAKHSSWSNAEGVKRTKHDAASIDVYALTNGDKVGYLRVTDVEHNIGAFSLHLEPPKKKNSRVRLIDNYKML